MDYFKGYSCRIILVNELNIPIQISYHSITNLPLLFNYVCYKIYNIFFLKQGANIY